MKITHLLSFIFILQIHAIDVSSQITGVFRTEKNEMTLQELITEIEHQTDYLFLYSRKDINLNSPVRIRDTSQPVTEILNEVLKDTDVKWEVNNNYISLRKKTATDLLAVNQQKKNVITGQVVDEFQDPVIGANIMIKGEKIGTITDLDGNFSIEAVEEDILLVSYIGFHSQEIKVGTRRVFPITLIEDTQKLEEVVVVGYGTQKRANLTGAVAMVTADVLEDRPITDLGQGLQGLVGNLTITPSGGAPGQGSNFNIRGKTSINDSGPLLLVDGVEMDLNMINPADVESVTVLKDAASSSIYGARAAYGVILVTTKKGKEGPPKINFTSNVSINSPTKMPEYMDSWTFANFHNETNRNSGGGDYYDETYMEHIYAYYKDPVNNLPVFVGQNNPNIYQYCGNTDWIRETRKTSTVMQQYNLSLNGRSHTTNYYASVGILNQEGFLKHYDDTYKRYNLNLNLNSQVRDWIGVNFRTRYNHAYKDAPFGTNNNDMNSGYFNNDLRPLMPIYHPDGHFSGQGSWTNQVAIQSISGSRKHKENDLWLTGGINLTPIQGMNINFDYTLNMYSINKKYHGKEIQEYTANPDIITIFPHISPNSVEFTNDDNYYHAVNAYADYTRQFGKHSLKGLVGYNYETKNYRWFNAKRENLIDNELGALGQAIGERYVKSGERQWAVMGYFYRLNYNYDDRYLLEINGRYDGSSKFPTNDRYTFFPSFSGAWRVSGETFFEPLRKVIDDFKVRASWGQLGNQSVGGDYPYIATLSTKVGKEYIMDGSTITGVGSAGLVSATLSWEKVSQMNIGFDWGVLNNRLYGSVEWYRRNTYDMITNGTPLPAVLGTSVPKQNSADLKTTGFEVALGWRNKPSRHFSYDVYFTLSDNKSTITKYDNPEMLLPSDVDYNDPDANKFYYKGQRIGEIWGYETAGLFQSQAEIDAHANQSKIYGGTWYPGDVKYKDQNGDNEISIGKNTLSDHGDLIIIGNTEPRFHYGIKGGFRYKDVDFDLFLQGIGKRDFMPNDPQFWGFTSEWSVPLAHAIDSWREGNENAFFPRSSYRNGNRERQTKYLQNAAYLRLKSVTVGYTLPQEILNKIKVDNIRIYVSGQNLLTFTSLADIYDPETLSVGAYPLYRSVSFGLNITF